ncbi:hypothetical protein D187_006885 [Cystobacter fuscus DSM 2262]|uniref:HEXXH motif domain-containing protein n=1 Tax=Cystobacter fuscus (strain ATCC 25194 / DSM 2262 / NBRC 100088 / M29) TaxID=1242864 RepID=S9P1Z9_CYSF2|nr:HEXXH motif-containing putative peptide modification protein [Cystobacter fuscus]EPX57131.1 hypothetical protein D187_006885 [Cystobacter fuscus DSM 2262]
MLQIIYSLTAGGSCPPLIDNQVEHFVQKLKFQFEDLLWLTRLSSAEMAREASAAYEALSARERYAFFLSPAVFSEMFRQQRSGKTPDLRGLIELCVGESALEASARGQARERWNPLFAKAVHAGGVEGNTYAAPLLGGSVTVDLSSPFCRRSDMTSPVFFGDFVPFTEEEKAQVLSKLSAAFAEIEATAPIFARIIRNYTRVACVRKREGALPASEQVSDEIGAIRLLNVHKPEYSHEQLMDDLIHESVHNLLSTYEYLEHPFQIVGGESDGDARPVSPWSMRPIRVLPFLHAVFVYFAILHYTLKRMERGELSAEQQRLALKRRNRYASGFLMPGKLSDYVKPFSNVDPRTLHAMDQMQQIIRRKFSPPSESRPENVAVAPAGGAQYQPPVQKGATP